MLHKVMLSDWAIPIVPVVKPNGTVRVCSYHKVTLNPNQLKTENNTFPRIDDIFAKLKGLKKVQQN